MVKKKIKLYADLANLNSISILKNERNISGFTTNPTILRKNNIKNYNDFMVKCSKMVYPKPVSFEVISDNPNLILEEAIKIGKINKNVFVKIPIVNSKGLKLYNVIKELSLLGLNLNITAVMTKNQIKNIFRNLQHANAIISIFAGRIADTGRDPIDIVNYAIKNKSFKKINILWASPREVFNFYQAQNIGCDIITMTPDLINKLKLKNYNLEKYSVDTAKMFFNDAKKSKLQIL